jgi:hypothetical protein
VYPYIVIEGTLDTVEVSLNHALGEGATIAEAADNCREALG